MPSAIRKTRIAWDNPGHAHFVTYSCYRRLPLLARDRSCRWIIETLQRVRRKLDIALWAYVIMPNHVHVLLHPRQADYSMRRILAGLKRPVSEAAKAHLLATGQAKWLEKLTVRYPSRTVFRFWQPGGGFDHNILREKTIPAVVSYIHENPVRRGLVAMSAEWVWSSARFWENQRDVPLRMDSPNAAIEERIIEEHCSQSSGTRNRAS